NTHSVLHLFTYRSGYLSVLHSFPTRRSSDLFVGRTGAGQEQVTVAVRLGSYGSLNAGKADFDDFRMEQLHEASSGTVVVPLDPRSEEHTSELQSPDHLVCRLLLEKKNNH